MLRDREMSVSYIVVALRSQQAYVSGKLKNLQGSRLVGYHRKDREVYCRLADPLLGDSLSLMFGPVRRNRGWPVRLLPSATLDERSKPMLSVKILGVGCPNCKRLEAETRAALDAEGIAYELEKVTDYADIMSYDVMSTPALVINERVFSAGRIPPRSRISEWAKELTVAAE